MEIFILVYYNLGFNLAVRRFYTLKAHIGTHEGVLREDKCMNDFCSYKYLWSRRVS